MTKLFLLLIKDYSPRRSNNIGKSNTVLLKGKALNSILNLRLSTRITEMMIMTMMITVMNMNKMTKIGIKLDFQ